MQDTACCNQNCGITEGMDIESLMRGMTCVCDSCSFGRKASKGAATEELCKVQRASKLTNSCAKGQLREQQPGVDEQLCCC